MKVNVENFKNILRKATLNFSISSVQLQLNQLKISSRMISENRDCIVILDVDNDVMAVSDEHEFNFSEPNQQLMPFLNLIDDDEADIDVHSEKIVVKNGRQRSNIHFCSGQIVSVFGTDAAREGIESFLTLDIDDGFNDAFAKIKKIGSRYGNVYFNVEDGVFSIETADKTNRFSNGLKFELTRMSDVPDLSICFDYKNFINLMAVINGDSENFTLEFSYVEEQEMGMVYAGKNDGNEKYYLMSKEI